MPISKETVSYVARLSRIELGQTELEKISRQLEAILGFIDTLNSVNVTGIQPTSHIVNPQNALREDTHRPGLKNEQTLANAPGKSEGFFTVPKVIE